MLYPPVSIWRVALGKKFQSSFSHSQPPEGCRIGFWCHPPHVVFVLWRLVETVVLLPIPLISSNSLSLVVWPTSASLATKLLLPISNFGEAQISLQKWYKFPCIFLIVCRVFCLVYCTHLPFKRINSFGQSLTPHVF